ncbi:lysozyme family protein [Goodfellowiella coeruleoviolacea]|nr:hypothetical protein [Goodfellowiella coeruleoviolacea]
MNVGKIGIAALILIPVLIAAGLSGAVSAVVGGGSQPSALALADIPTHYLTLYRQAATVCPGLDWSVLAPIGKIESDHGRSTLIDVADGTENHAGAGGPMQFLADSFTATVTRHSVPPGGAPAVAVQPARRQLRRRVLPVRQRPHPR